MEIPTTVPAQHRDSVGIRLLKRFLKTQVGKHIAFSLGLKGFDRVGFRILRFQGFDADGKPLYKPEPFRFSYNARVNKGADLQASLMSGSSLNSISSPTYPKYIALSTSSLTAAAGDTTLSGETSATGLARAAGTIQNYVGPSSLDGAASYDIFKQFTNTSGGSVTVQSSALFDAASTGNMFAEANLSSSATLANNDILQITWTVNL